MTRVIPRVAVACLLASACGELSSNPGADAGTRIPCAFCNGVATFTCVQAECLPECRTTGSFACLSETQRCLGSACIQNTQPDCDDVPCNADQRCIGDFCVPKGDVACTTLDDAACGAEALCDLDSRTCVELPYCDAGFTCRPGRRGATCNNVSDLQQDRHPRVSGPKCLLGYCAIDADCPAGERCGDVGATHATLGTCR